MNGMYLIPANTKRGQLILGLFRPIDLTIFLSGVGITFLLLMIIPMENAIAATIILLPALVCALLVAPLPNYHNVMTILVEIYEYLTSQQKYKWKGWCFIDEFKNERENNRGLDQGLTRNQ